MIKEAIAARRLIRIWDMEGRERILEPYALHQGKEEVLLHAFQLGGYSSSPNPQGWRNLKLSQIKHTELLGSFLPRPEYNPTKLKLLEV